VLLAASKNQNFLHGAVILELAVIITKVLGAVYKIPLGNILGDVGFAHFTAAYNLYNVLLTLSTAGLPVALARLVSEANSLDRPNQVQRTYKVALVTFIVLGLIWTSVMFLFPTELAYFIGDVEASQSITAMVPAVILVCIMSAFRGYTQGLSDMRPTSISQVIEVAAKVAFGLSLVMIMAKKGLGTPMLSAGAISGVAVGSLAACIYIWIVARNREKSEALRYAGTDVLEKDVPDSKSVILKRLLSVGIPIALGSCVLSVISLINTKLIYARLQSGAGYTFEESQVLFGVYSKAMTLYNLPAAIITPLTVSVVPAISGYFATRNYSEAKIVTESSLRIATIIALPMAVGLSVLSGPVMDGLYHGSAEQGGTLLAIMGAASFFVCLALMTTAILQAAGREQFPMFTMLLGGLLNIAVNWYLIGQKNINIYGAPIGTFVCYIFMSGLNLFFLMKKMPQKPRLDRVFIMPVINCAIMGLVAWIMYPAVLKLLGASLDPSRMEILISLAASIAVAATVYLVITILTQAITKEDMKLLPKGERLAQILHIK